MDKVEVIMRLVMQKEGGYATLLSQQILVRAKKPSSNEEDLALVTIACCNVMKDLTGFDPTESLHHYKECVEPLINP